MKKFLAIATVLALSACAGYQAKIDNALAKVDAAKEAVECRLDVLEPYLAYITSEDLVSYLEGANIGDLLAAIEVAKDETAKAKVAFADCGKISLK